MLRVTGIRLGLDESEKALRKKIAARLEIKEKDIIDFHIYRKSIDARRSDIYFVYTVDVSVRNEGRVLARRHDRSVTVSPDLEYRYVRPGREKLVHRPVIVGTGPSGLFAGLILSQMGYRPLLLERGEEVDARLGKVQRFWDGGALDGESNVQFGEGGAGTFSDGKLTTLIKDNRCRKVLEEFVRAGAPREILVLNKPHVGTDLLGPVIKNIRQSIIANGGEVRFKSKVTDLEIRDDRVTAVVVNECESIPCEVVLLGIGHSARDTFAMLHRRGVLMTRKPFSVGVRIEHPQALIDAAQYGDFAGDPRLGAADYKLAYHSPSGRSAYTFCMCPGGYVIAAASEAGGVITNGMSEYRRDGANANSAFLVGVAPGDYGSDHPLAGIEFQRRWERLAYRMAGSNYHAPVQLVGDFLRDRPSTRFGSVTPTYRPGVTFVELKNCLPFYVVETIKEALVHFETKIHGFAMPEAVMTGVETRSSSAVRINRDENYMASVGGLYPIGEGAGYAGGIISAAVDGIKAAEKVAERYAPLV